MKANLIAFDLETTGRDRDSARIVQFCFVGLAADLSVVGSWVGLVDPRCEIEEEAHGVHGIGPEQVAGMPAFAELAPKVQALIRGRPLMAYNSRFDVTVLHRELQREGLPGIAPDHPVVDPFRIFQRHHQRTLEAALELYCGRTLEGAHDAEVDVLAMVDVYRAQIEAHGLADGDHVANAEEVDPAAVDIGGKLVRGDDGRVRFNFGKHKGQALLDQPGYCRWMLGADFPPDVKAVVEREMRGAG